MSRRFGGVETGGTWTVCALGSGPEDIVAKERFPTTNPPETLARIVAFFAVRELPAALGVGSFGPIDVDRSSPRWGEVTTTPKPGWRHAQVARAIGEKLGVPVSFDTDVAVAALGEHRWGAGRGSQSLCYLTVGTGIGAGLLLDGRPWHGLIHPEVGHMRIPHDRDAVPFAGSCPWHGDCLEGLASGRAIEARWGMPAERLPVEHVGWELEARYIALGILNIACVVSPDRVIAGGGVFDHPTLLESVRGHLRDLVGGYLETPLLRDGIDRYVVSPELGDDAGVLGAIAMAELSAG